MMCICHLHAQQSPEVLQSHAQGKLVWFHTRVPLTKTYWFVSRLTNESVPSSENHVSTRYGQKPFYMLDHDLDCAIAAGAVA